MSVAFELEFEACPRPFRLHALPDQPVRVAPSPLVRPVRMVLAVGLAAFVLVLLVLLALPLRQLGGSTLAQDPPAAGQEYIVKPGDSLVSIAQQADPGNPSSMASSIAREVGSRVVVPGEHIEIP